MAHGRAWAAGAAVSGCLYVCGGAGDGAAPLRSVERFDAAAGRWERMPDMREPRVLGRLCVCGGMNPCTASAEWLDPATGAWEALPPMRQARAGAAAAVFCGVNLDTSESLGHHGSWRPEPPMARRRFRAAAAAAAGGLYACGGESVRGVEPTVEVLLPGACRWEAAPGMRLRRMGSFAAAVAGCLWVGGGSSCGSGRALDLEPEGSSERLDLELGDGDEAAWELVTAAGASAARRGDVW
ncbi:unnamed protein product, partial [Prorocentrum cordatum]